MANVGPHLILAERTFQVGSGLQFTVRAYKEKGRTLIRFAVEKAGYRPSYFYETLAGTTSSDRKPRERGRGLCLHGGNPAWDIDGETMDRVMDWLADEIGPAPFEPYDDDPRVPF